MFKLSAITQAKVVKNDAFKIAKDSVAVSSTISSKAAAQAEVELDLSNVFLLDRLSLQQSVYPCTYLSLLLNFPLSIYLFSTDYSTRFVDETQNILLGVIIYFNFSSD